MKITRTYLPAIAMVCIWIGFLGAISFMEAWLKFQAPGMTLSLGLGVGKLVFAALNRVEITLLLLISVFFWYMRETALLRKRGYIIFVLIAIIVLLQTIWLLPALDARADMYISGAEVPPSSMHLYYVILECIKMVSLILLGLSLAYDHVRL